MTRKRRRRETAEQFSGYLGHVKGFANQSEHQGMLGDLLRIRGRGLTGLSYGGIVIFNALGTIDCGQAYGEGLGFKDFSL